MLRKYLNKLFDLIFSFKEFDKIEFNITKEEITSQLYKV